MSLYYVNCVSLVESTLFRSEKGGTCECRLLGTDIETTDTCRDKLQRPQWRTYLRSLISQELGKTGL